MKLRLINLTVRRNLVQHVFSKTTGLFATFIRIAQFSDVFTYSAIHEIMDFNRENSNEAGKAGKKINIAPIRLHR